MIPILCSVTFTLEKPFHLSRQVGGEVRHQDAHRDRSADNHASHSSLVRTQRSSEMDIEDNTFHALPSAASEGGLTRLPMFRVAHFLHLLSYRGETLSTENSRWRFHRSVTAVDAFLQRLHPRLAVGGRLKKIGGVPFRDAQGRTYWITRLFPTPYGLPCTCLLLGRQIASLPPPKNSRSGSHAISRGRSHRVASLDAHVVSLVYVE